jgi:hypothetical protein
MKAKIAAFPLKLRARVGFRFQPLNFSGHFLVAGARTFAVEALKLREFAAADI